jgi:hypothetical protein
MVSPSSTISRIRASSGVGRRVAQPVEAYSNWAKPVALPPGRAAEQKFHGQQGWNFVGDVLKEMRNIRARVGEGKWDLRAVALSPLDDDPAISLNAARTAAIYCQKHTEEILAKPRVSAGAERVVNALLRRRHLSPRAALAIRNSNMPNSTPFKVEIRTSSSTNFSTAGRALLPHLPKFIGKIWKPACGSGKMVAALRQAGFEVVGSEGAR